MYQLSNRLRGSGVTINAISPGFFVNTTIYRNLRGVFHVGATLVFGFGTLLGLNTPQRSAKTYFWLATDASLEGVTAKYYEHKKEKETSALARGDEPARKLWAWSAKQTGVGTDA
jgi:NAD(P)-dependent dehydrogenase (short-subunit alcohol dehydrogenase family)